MSNATPKPASSSHDEQARALLRAVADSDGDPLRRARAALDYGKAEAIARALVIGAGAVVREEQAHDVTRGSMQTDDLLVIAMAERMYREDPAAVEALMPGEVGELQHALLAAVVLFVNTLALQNDVPVEQALRILRANITAPSPGPSTGVDA